MYAGKPIIVGFSGKSRLIEDAKCGSVIKPEDSDALIDEIYRFKGMSSHHRREIGQNGRVYLKKYLNYEHHAETLLEAINNI